MNLLTLKNHIVALARSEGFDDCAVVDIEVSNEAKQVLYAWLKTKVYGDMTYLARHADIKTNPTQLLPEALRAICVRMTYKQQSVREMSGILHDAQSGYIAQYALGRDYHKVVKQRLNKLIKILQTEIPDAKFRACCDSAPVMEIAFACRSQLGWRGKHGLLIHPSTGSFFVLGELLTDLPLPVDTPMSNKCGRCHRCIDGCPTKAIQPDGTLKADQCISYLTIEHQSAIPLEMRPLIGNRIFGCDDCQLKCPWNRFETHTNIADFKARQAVFNQSLTDLFMWTKEEFEHKTAGSPIRRLSYSRWLRNIAVALGNAPPSPKIIETLQSRLFDNDPMVVEHVQWALAQHAK